MSITLPILEAPGVYGTRGRTSYSSYEVEPSWRRFVFEMDVNASLDLVGMTSMLKTRPEKNAVFMYSEKPFVRGLATGVKFYKDPLFSSAYGAGDAGTVNSTVYVKVDADIITHLRPRHICHFTVPNTPELAFNGEVLTVTPNGSNSCVELRLLADGSSALPASSTKTPSYATNGVLLAATRLQIISNIAPDQAFVGQGVTYNKVYYQQHCQILRTPIKLTRRAQRQNTRFSDGNALEQARRDNLKMHARDIEGALCFGTIDDGTNIVEGEVQTAMQGLIPCIRERFPENEVNFYSSVDSDFAGYSWDLAGLEFVNQQFQQLFTFGPSERTILCGNGFLAGIQRVAMLNSQLDIVTGQTEFGVKIVRWVTPWGTVYFKTYAPFVLHPDYTYSGLAVVPDYLGLAVIDDTTFRPLNEGTNRRPGQTGRMDSRGFDGAIEEWLSDLALEVNGAQAMMIMHGVGLNNITYTP